MKKVWLIDLGGAHYEVENVETFDDAVEALTSDVTFREFLDEKRCSCTTVNAESKERKV